ncbi:MAG: protein-glutamate O-methyltransferase CheR [Deltaproteobacteria bacterium]|nr:protein-glutamate O-methyltransferase CheR [Myxococcales bacterium]MDP3216225.1 protein-glutamate O-methyltransferase CheR [Deltaproteobacteria bacterium]
MKSASQPALHPALREAFAARVRESFGLVFPPSRAGALDQGVAAAAEALGGIDAAALYERLVGGDGAAHDAIIKELTVGETYLFRDDHHFAFVRDVALPEALRRGDRVRLWSAGCATGEEAWSLAIVAHEALGEHAGRVEVIGTDINQRFLDRARLGWYGPWSFRDVDPARRERWFVPERNGWSVRESVRRSVRFSPLNLLDLDSAEWPSAVDVIFCRNVAIYFDLETIARVAARLARSLHGGGWMVPGPSDPLLPDGLGLTATFRGPLVYRRDQPAPALPAPPPAPGRRSTVPRPRRRATPFTSGATPRLPAPKAPIVVRDPAGAARALADLGDLAGAVRLLDAALAIDGLDPALYLLRSTVRQASGDDRGACDDAEKAIVIDRTLPLAHVLSAAARTRIGDVASARRALRNARALLLRVSAEAPIRHGPGQTRGSLLAVCDRLANTLGGTPPPRRGT